LEVTTMTNNVMRAVEIVARRLKDVEKSNDSMVCKAEGMLQVALEAMEGAANLLGDDQAEPAAALVLTGVAGVPPEDIVAPLPGAEAPGLFIAALILDEPREAGTPTKADHLWIDESDDISIHRTFEAAAARARKSAEENPGDAGYPVIRKGVVAKVVRSFGATKTIVVEEA
jgi:hypothetical protein